MTQTAYSASRWLILSVRRNRADYEAGELDARLAIREPSLAAGEIAVRLNLEVPRAFFETPALRVNVKLEGEPQAAEVDVTAVEEAIRKGTDLKVSVTMDPDPDFEVKP